MNALQHLAHAAPWCARKPAFPLSRMSYFRAAAASLRRPTAGPAAKRGGGRVQRTSASSARTCHGSAGQASGWAATPQGPQSSAAVGRGNARNRNRGRTGTAQPAGQFGQVQSPGGSLAGVGPAHGVRRAAAGKLLPMSAWAASNAAGRGWRGNIPHLSGWGKVLQLTHAATRWPRQPAPLMTDTPAHWNLSC